MALKLRSSIAINSSAKLIKKRDFPGIGAQLLNVRSLGGGKLKIAISVKKRRRFENHCLSTPSSSHRFGRKKKQFQIMDHVSANYPLCISKCRYH